MRKSSQSTASYGGEKFTVVQDAPEHRRVADLTGLQSKHLYAKDAKAGLGKHNAHVIEPWRNQKPKLNGSEYVTVVNEKTPHGSTEHRLHGVKSLLKKFDTSDEDEHALASPHTKVDPKFKVTDDTRPPVVQDAEAPSTDDDEQVVARMLQPTKNIEHEHDVERMPRLSYHEQDIESMPTDDGSSWPTGETVPQLPFEFDFAAKLVRGSICEALESLDTQEQVSNHDHDHDHDHDHADDHNDRCNQREVDAERIALHLQSPGARHGLELAFAHEFTETLWSDAIAEALRLETTASTSASDRAMVHVLNNCVSDLQAKDNHPLDHTANAQREKHAHDKHLLDLERLAALSQPKLQGKKSVASTKSKRPPSKTKPNTSTFATPTKSKSKPKSNSNSTHNTPTKPTKQQGTPKIKKPDGSQPIGERQQRLEKAKAEENKIKEEATAAARSKQRQLEHHKLVKLQTARELRDQKLRENKLERKAVEEQQLAQQKATRNANAKSQAKRLQQLSNARETRDKGRAATKQLAREKVLLAEKESRLRHKKELEQLRHNNARVTKRLLLTTSTIENEDTSYDELDTDVQLHDHDHDDNDTTELSDTAREAVLEKRRRRLQQQIEQAKTKQQQVSEVVQATIQTMEAESKGSVEAAANAEKEESQRLARLLESNPLTPKKQRDEEDEVAKNQIYAKIEVRKRNFLTKTTQELREFDEAQAGELEEFDKSTRRRRNQELADYKTPTKHKTPINRR